MNNFQEEMTTRLGPALVTFEINNTEKGISSNIVEITSLDDDCNIKHMYSDKDLTDILTQFNPLKYYGNRNELIYLKLTSNQRDKLNGMLNDATQNILDYLENPDNIARFYIKNMTADWASHTYNKLTSLDKFEISRNWFNELSKHKSDKLADTMMISKDFIATTNVSKYDITSNLKVEMTPDKEDVFKISNR